MEGRDFVQATCHQGLGCSAEEENHTKCSAWDLAVGRLSPQSGRTSSALVRGARAVGPMLGPLSQHHDHSGQKLLCWHLGWTERVTHLVSHSVCFVDSHLEVDV